MNIVLCPFTCMKDTRGNSSRQFSDRAEEFEGKSPLRFSDVYSIAYDKPGRRFKSSCVAIPTSAHLPFTTSVMNIPWISFWDRLVNKKLKTLGEPHIMEEATALSELSCFEYQAGTWACPRQVIYKAEITKGKPNPRFVVTNIKNRTPKFLYEKVYCARGRMEGFIKNHKTYFTRTGHPAIASRQTSSASFCTVPPTCYCTRSKTSVSEDHDGRNPTSIQSNSAS